MGGGIADRPGDRRRVHRVVVERLWWIERVLERHPALFALVLGEAVVVDLDVDATAPVVHRDGDARCASPEAAATCSAPEPISVFPLRGTSPLLRIGTEPQGDGGSAG